MRVLFRSEDTRSFRHAYLNWFWGSYTAVYLGLATAAYDELRRVVHTRQPEGYTQPLAYHPDVRRHVAEMSIDLEAARLITYRSAWLTDTEGPTEETTAAVLRSQKSDISPSALAMIAGARAQLANGKG
jgi:alkylation response protein AidB-like acyl-CoA dehydrogenase